jgi:hypothetical protein
VVKHAKSKTKNKKEKMYKISWAKLLKRVFDFEVERCECGCQLKFKRAVWGQDFAIGILKSLHIEAYVPNPAPARGPPQERFEFN